MSHIRYFGAALFFLAGCQEIHKAWDGMEKPTARIAGVGFDNLSLDSVTLRFDVEVGNPYAFALPLTKMDYALNSGGKRFLSGVSDVRGTVPAKGRRTIPLTAAVNFSDLMSVVGGIRPGRTVPYEAAMLLSADAPAIGTVSVPFKHEGQVPVPAVPEVRVQSMRWDELSLNSAKATMIMDVKNTNDFAVGLEKMGYALSLAGQDVAFGGLTGTARFDKGQMQTVEVPVSFSPAQFGLAMFNLLRGDKADYKLTGDMDLSTAFGPIKMPYHSHGQTKLTK